MDPQAVWTSLFEALAESDLAEARNHATNLLEWLAKGGFPPQVTSDLRGNDVNRRICRKICQQILEPSFTDGD